MPKKSRKILRDKNILQKDKVFSITSLVCGLLFWVPLFNVLLGPLAVIFGIMSLRRIHDFPERYGGSWLAIIGLVLGVISVIFTIIGIYIQIANPQFGINSNATITLPWNSK
jgi:hypothetical protein